MKKKFFLKILAFFLFLSLSEFIILKILNEKLIENMIQLMLFNVAVLAFYTWSKDNKISNVEIVFEFDKRWDELIKEMNKEAEKSIKAFDRLGKQLRNSNESDNKDKSGRDINKILISYHSKLEGLFDIQKDFRFLFEKIKHYEKNLEDNEVTTFLNSRSVIRSAMRFNKNFVNNENYADIIGKSEIINKTLMDIIDIYEENLDRLKKYIADSKIEDKQQQFDDIEKVKNGFDEFKNDLKYISAREQKFKDYITKTEHIQEKKANPENLEEDISDEGKLIASVVGNNRFFKASDDKILVSTSRNWRERENKYGTWYAILSENIKDGLVEDYYFIVRQPNENNEFPYLYIDRENMRKLSEQKEETKDGRYHFYFSWDIENGGDKVIDERGKCMKTIHLDDERIEFEMGKMQLKGDKLYRLNHI